MTPETVNAVFDALSAKLSVPTAQFLEIVPRIGAKDFYVALILGIITLVIILIAVIFALIEHEPSIAIAGLILAIFPAVICCSFIPDAILWKNDPVAWAVQYLIEALKTGAQ